MENKTLNQIYFESQSELDDELLRAMEFIDSKTSGKKEDEYLSIGELETVCSSLIEKTKNIYLSRFSEALSNLDEKELIVSKKENSRRKG